MKEIIESKLKKDNFCIFNKDCINMRKIPDNFVNTIITDPPYGISFKNEKWDKYLPNNEIWKECERILKPGGYMLVFSYPRIMHKIMCQIEDIGFLIKDVLFWVYLNGMPKIGNIGVKIDKKLGYKSEKIGNYKYIQGYEKKKKESYKKNKDIYIPTSELGKKFQDTGLTLKPAYEPIILFQKPVEKNNIENLINYETGVINILEARIPFEENEKKVGHNPNSKGRYPSNIIRTDIFNDGYDKFFVIPKVRGKEKELTDKEGNIIEY